MPEELQGKTASLPESAERKPSPGDPFTEDPKTEWAEFQLGAEPFNKAQKAVDFSKSKQLWHFLGKTSTESKAQYTADISKPVHDLDSNFLQTVEPLKPVMAPPTQPKRQSLAASYPTSAAFNNMAARNAAMISQRQQLLEQQHRQPQRQPYSMVNAVAPLARPQVSPDQRQILERQQQRAQQLDMQERPYGTAHETQRPVPGVGGGIGIDMQAVERQRQFMQNAAKESRNYKEWSYDGWSAGQGMSLPPLHNYRGFPPTQQAPLSSPPEAPYHDYKPYTSPAGPHATMQSYHRPSETLALVQPSQQSHQGPTVSDTRLPTQSVNEQPHHDQMGEVVAPAHRMDPVGAYEDQIRIQNERARVEQVRAAANQLPTDSFQHERRISGSISFPFKPPEELKAQKEVREAVEHSQSRPGSGYLQHQSPPVKQEQHPTFHYHSLQQQPPSHILPDTQHPLSFINPNATQIRPSTSSSSYSSVLNMGPPSAAFHRSSISNITMDAPMSLSRAQHDPIQVAKFHQRSMIQPPSHKLLAAMTPLPRLSNGRAINDRPLPDEYVQWKKGGGFWGSVADYFNRSHVESTNVYRSPYAAEGAKKEEALANNTLALEFYDKLTSEDKAKIDEARKRKEVDPGKEAARLMM